MATGTKPYLNWIVVVILTIVAGSLFVSCDDLFVNDGDPDKGISPRGGYFYFIDNENFQLKMLDPNLKALGVWDTRPLFDTTRVQGITFDDAKVWLSVAGDFDDIVQVDLTGSEIVVLRQFDAPPERHGTIRDIAWDGTNIWALNSGSTTYNVPPTLYKLNATSGAILAEYVVPTPEPRGLTWVGANGDAYNRGADIGLYYGETTQDQIIYFNVDKQQFDTVFASPEPPSGEYDIFPVGLCFDGAAFWLVNSALSGDHLYELTYQGTIIEEIELSYKTPGPIAWSTVDAMAANPPTVLACDPSTGAHWSNLTISIMGSDFRPGAGLDVSFGDGIDVSNITFVDGNTITVDIEIDTTAAYGPRDVTVTNPDGKFGVGVGLFSVLEINPLDGYLWLIRSDDNTVYKIKILDTTVAQTWSLSSVAPGGSPQGITYYNGSIWMTAGGSDDLVERINFDDDPPSTEVSFATPTDLGVVREVAFLGTDLWVANSGAGASFVYRMNSGTGAVVDSIAAPGTEIRGLASANGELYCTDRTTDSVYVYDFDAGSWVNLFATPTPTGGTTSNRYSTGMTFDGVNFWIVNSTNEFDHIYQVSLSGQVLREYPAPSLGAATYTGVAFTQD